MKKLLIAAAGTMALAMASQASAATYILTATGATATVTTGVNTMTVVMTDTLGNPVSEASAISGLELFLSATPVGETLFSQSGALIQINDDHTTNVVAGNPTHWGVGNTGSTLFLETAGPFAAGGQPKNLIVGPGPYTQNNNGFDNFNPYINQTGTFVINFTSGGTPVITGGKFEFNTSGTNFVETTCTSGCSVIQQSVPEPMTWALMLTGFGGMGALLRRRRAQVAAAAA